MPEISARRQEVADRAGRRCEYCLISEQDSFARHQVDHVIPLKHGDETALDNLALCCARCNRRKGSDLSSFDPATGELAPFFNPLSLGPHHRQPSAPEIAPTSIAQSCAVKLVADPKPAFADE